MKAGTLCDVLIAEGVITVDEISLLDSSAANDNAELFDYIISGGSMRFDDVAELLEKHYAISYYDLVENEVSEDAAGLLDHKLAVKYNVLPVMVRNKRIFLAMANPFKLTALDDVSVMTGLIALPVLSRLNDIKLFINRHYGAAQINTIESQFIVDENIRNKNYVLDPKQRADIQNAPTVRLIDSLIDTAILYGSSDIHIEPFEKSVRTRYRIDGRLKEFQNVHMSLLPYIISRLKIMGGMDIAEKRLPQDGHFTFGSDMNKIDFRISTIPTIYGEKAVIRLIYNAVGRISKEDLGFFPEDMEKISGMFNSPHGAVLVTGPTGSGKTTTIATFLNDMNNEDVNIVTIEDPVEKQIYGINQININTKANLDFDDILRSVLRQDPDIIMVGEIRDSKTAGTAIRSAITGHLVLSTLHTNDAVSAIMRLIDMGIDNYLISSAVRGILSQRLVRKICPYCKEGYGINKNEAVLLKIPAGTTVYKGKGCTRCNNEGYKGRFAIYEYFEFDNDIREAIGNRSSYDGIRSVLANKGMSTIWDNALRNVLAGNTTVTEMYKAVFIEF